MRYLFKTDYRQDTTVWRHSGDLFWYGLLGVVLLVIPFVLSEFYVGELGGVFVFAVAGVGMMLLAGYFLPAGFQEVTSNVVLLATLILRPQGLFAEIAGKRV